MRGGIDRRTVLVVGIVLGVLVGLSGIGAASPDAAFHPGERADVAAAAGGPSGAVARDDRPVADLAHRADSDENGEEVGGEGEDDDGEGDDGEAGEGSSVLGDWWGLAGEAAETPYLGLAEFGVAILGVGLGGYAVGKRTSLLPSRSRRYLLPAHEWTMVLGTGLTVPHFLAVEEWEGIGLAVGLLLGIEVLSGLYGRHLHRHVVRLGRGAETTRPVGRLIEVSKRGLFARWRRIHVVLTLVTGLVLALHVVTALGE